MFIDKFRDLNNNVITLIKYLIKDNKKLEVQSTFNKQGGKYYVTAGYDLSRSNYFQRGSRTRDVRQPGFG